MVKKRFFSIVFTTTFFLCSVFSQSNPIPVGSSIKKLSSGQFSFLEGPVWYVDSVMLFTDLGVNPTKIYSYEPDGKQFAIFRSDAQGCNGLTLGRDGGLIGCEAKTKRIVTMDKSGVITEALAGIYNNKTFNSPNDLIADSNGGIYFTDPVFGTSPIQDKEGVYYLDSSGNVTRIIDVLAKPNGVILSPDGTRLYVVDTNNKYLYAWDVASDGSVSGKTNLAVLQTTGGPVSGADGMAVDIHGNIYVTSDKGIQIFTPEGVSIATILVPEKPTNCDFGGNDFKTLYITAGKNLYSIGLNYPGYGISRLASPNAVNPTQNKPYVNIYPNPATDFVLLKTGSTRPFSVKIIDSCGRQIYEKEHIISEFNLNVSRFPNGIYFLCTSIPGSMEFVQQSKLVIKR